MSEVSIQLINPANGLLLSGSEHRLVDRAGGEFLAPDGIFRFVNDDNYTDNFGFQWNKFRQTQIDRDLKGSQQSAERFFAATGWVRDGLEGQNILEVGSGAGRFSSVILKCTKANLYTVDYSNAVEANVKNNGPDERLRIFQASIYALPFAPAQFDKVICFGVLQHTPDFRQSVKCLTEMVKPGGEVIVDFYPIRGWYTKIHAKYLLRPFAKDMSNERLLLLIENNVDRLIAAYRFLEKVGLGKLNRFVPICDIRNTIPSGLSEAELREWVILDTFDMFSPQYDNPQRLSTVVKWFKEFGVRTVRGKVIAYGNGNSIDVVCAIR